MIVGVGVTSGRGRVESELAAIRAGCAVIECPGTEIVELAGVDRHRFLNGYVTNAVSDLAPGQTTYAFFTTAQGRVLADVVVATQTDRFWLGLPPGMCDEIASHLSRYVIADQVEIGRLMWAAVTLVGPPQLLRWTEGPPGKGVGKAVVESIPCVVVDRPVAGEPALTLWVPSETAAELRSRVSEAVVAAGGVVVGAEALEIARIESGRPTFGIDFGPDTFPQETGLEEEAVSYDKGCYLGQEVVARIHFRGRVNRCLRGLRFDGPPPSPGSALLLDDREVGVATSVGTSPTEGGIGLGILHRRAEAGATVVTADGVSATVVELPFRSLDGEGC